jgi:ABC-2 type transport system permease protein
MSFVLFFYCLGALYDDRRDRSILFWKSLPISDTSTVLSKVVSATILAPVIAAVIGVIMGLLLLLILATTLAFHGANVWQLLTLAHPFRVIANVVGYIPLYLLWALPSVGWLLFCSAWSRSKPFLWAIVVPVVAGVMVWWFDIMGLFDQSTAWFWTHVVVRGLLSVCPLVIFVLEPQDRYGTHSLDLIQSYQALGNLNLWIGAVVGAGLIAGAIWFRRWRDDS